MIVCVNMLGENMEEIEINFEVDNGNRQILKALYEEDKEMYEQFRQQYLVV